MSQIVIVLDSKIETSVLFEVKKITKESIDKLRSAEENNKPIYSCDLFYNNHDDVSGILKNLISLLDKSSSYKIYELDEDEVYDVVKSRGKEITRDTLINILDSFDREVERQQNA